MCKIKNTEWYSIAHDKVKDRFEGDLTYIGTWDMRDQYQPFAVYKNANPNRSKNHKDYMLLLLEPISHRMWVAGMDSEEMEKYRYRKGMECPNCQTIIWSCMRHDYVRCDCGDCSVDGGNAYFKYSGTGKIVTIDLIEKKVVK